MSQRFAFQQTDIDSLYRVERQLFNDDRGFFSRFFCTEEFKKIGLHKPIVQMNHSMTRQKGAVRGMHFQYPPYAEIKIVTCLHGSVWDVAVDLRKGSPTFLHWHAEELRADNQMSLFIPQGFAHGFQTLTEDCELLYLHSAPYTPEKEGGVNPLDPKLNINWPLEITEMSQKDHNCPMLGIGFKGIDIL